MHNRAYSFLATFIVLLIIALHTWQLTHRSAAHTTHSTVLPKVMRMHGPLSERSDSFLSELVDAYSTAISLRTTWSMHTFVLDDVPNNDVLRSRLDSIDVGDTTFLRFTSDNNGTGLGISAWYHRAVSRLDTNITDRVRLLVICGTVSSGRESFSIELCKRWILNTARMQQPSHTNAIDWMYVPYANESFIAPDGEVWCDGSFHGTARGMDEHGWPCHHTDTEDTVANTETPLKRLMDTFLPHITMVVRSNGRWPTAYITPYDDLPIVPHTNARMRAVFEWMHVGMRTLTPAYYTSGYELKGASHGTLVDYAYRTSVSALPFTLNVRGDREWCNLNRTDDDRFFRWDGLWDRLYRTEKHNRMSDDAFHVMWERNYGSLSKRV